MSASSSRRTSRRMGRIRGSGEREDTRRPAPRDRAAPPPRPRGGDRGSGRGLHRDPADHGRLHGSGWPGTARGERGRTALRRLVRPGLEGARPGRARLLAGLRAPSSVRRAHPAARGAADRRAWRGGARRLPPLPRNAGATVATRRSDAGAALVRGGLPRPLSAPGRDPRVGSCVGGARRRHPGGVGSCRRPPRAARRGSVPPELDLDMEGIRRSCGTGHLRTRAGRPLALPGRAPRRPRCVPGERPRVPWRLGASGRCERRSRVDRRAAGVGSRRARHVRDKRLPLRHEVGIPLRRRQGDRALQGARRIRVAAAALLEGPGAPTSPLGVFSPGDGGSRSARRPAPQAGDSSSTRRRSRGTRETTP